MFVHRYACVHPTNELSGYSLAILLQFACVLSSFWMFFLASRSHILAEDGEEDGVSLSVEGVDVVALTATLRCEHGCLCRMEECRSTHLTLPLLVPRWFKIPEESLNCLVFLSIVWPSMMITVVHRVSYILLWQWSGCFFQLHSSAFAADRFCTACLSSWS